MHRMLMAIATIAFVFASPSKAAESKRVGVLWIGKSGMAKSVTKGLLSTLKAKAPEIELEFKPELPDEAAAKSIYDAWQGEKDGIVFLRSSGAKYMGKHPPKVPGFCGGCTNPVLLGAASSLEKPDKNVTGVTYYLNSAKQLDLLKQIFPDMKTIGLLTEKGHPSSPLDQKETKAWCKEKGITLLDGSCGSKKEVLVTTKELAGKADLLVIGNQALIADNAKMMLDLAGETPIASYQKKPLQAKAAICGLVPDDEKLGSLLAETIIEVVKNGKAVAEVPIRVDPDPKFTVVPIVAKKFNVTIPASLMKNAKVLQ